MSLGVVDFGHFVTVVSIIAIAMILSDAGLNAIGQRQYTLSTTDDEKEKLLANLLGLRLLIAPVGALLAVGFTVIAGYSDVMIWGTVLAGAGFIIFMVQTTLTIPLSVELRLTALTFTEVLRQFVTVVCYGLLIIAGTSLLPFFAVPIPAAIAALIATVFLVGRIAHLRPTLEIKTCRFLLIQSLPVALAMSVNVIYFRLLIIMMSLLAVGVETGLFATSFRILEILVGIPVLMLTTALPVLSRAASQNIDRLRYILQRIFEVAFIMASYLILMVVITASPVIEILGGPDYQGAAPVLQIMVFALLGSFIGGGWQLGLISTHRQSALIISNTVALVTVFVLGFILIESNGAIGAAYATAVGEVVLAVATLLLLIRSDRRLTPNFSFCPKVLLVSGLAAATFLIPGLNPFITAAFASLIFWGSAYILRVVPREAIDAIFKQGSE